MEKQNPGPSFTKSGRTKEPKKKKMKERDKDKHKQDPLKDAPKKLTSVKLPPYALVPNPSYLTNDALTRYMQRSYPSPQKNREQLGEYYSRTDSKLLEPDDDYLQRIPCLNESPSKSSPNKSPEKEIFKPYWKLRTSNEKDKSRVDVKTGNDVKLKPLRLAWNEKRNANSTFQQMMFVDDDPVGTRFVKSRCKKVCLLFLFLLILAVTCTVIIYFTVFKGLWTLVPETSSINGHSRNSQNATSITQTKSQHGISTIATLQPKPPKTEPPDDDTPQAGRQGGELKQGDSDSRFMRTSNSSHVDEMTSQAATTEVLASQVTTIATTTAATTSSRMTGGEMATCLQHPIVLDVCKGLPYNTTVFSPGVQRNLTASLESVRLLIPHLEACYEHAHLILCGMVLPTCANDGFSALPCRNLCLEFKSSCDHIFSRASSLDAALNCDTNMERHICLDVDGIRYPENFHSVQTSPTVKSPTRQCRRIHDSFCHGLPYNRTVFPNFVPESTPEESSHTLGILAIVDENTPCSRWLKTYACAALNPRCDDSGEAVPPCRSLCEDVRRECRLVIERFGISLPWDCMAFPDSSNPAVCSGAQVSTRRRVRRRHHGYVCREGQFQCRNRKCRHFSLVCDGKDDCGDGSDESGCSSEACTGGWESCLDGTNVHSVVNNTCIASRWRCDGVSDCSCRGERCIGSDEMNCSGIVKEVSWRHKQILSRAFNQRRIKL